MPRNSTDPSISFLFYNKTKKGPFVQELKEIAQSHSLPEILMSTICILVFSHKQALSPEDLRSGCSPGIVVPAGRTAQPPCPPPGQACVGGEMQNWLGGAQGPESSKKGG